MLMNTRVHTQAQTHTRSCTREIKSTFDVLLSTMAAKYSSCVCVSVYVTQTKIMILTHDDPYLNWRNIQQFAVIDAIPSQ